MALPAEVAAVRAKELFDGGRSCAETTMMVLQEVYGLEGDRLWNVASGFGGGVGRYQSICGALAGGVMAMGLLESRAAEDPTKVAEALRPRVSRLLESFQERFGAIECRGLVSHDFRAPGGFEAHKQSNEKQEKCHPYVRYVVETLAREFEGKGR